MREWLKGNVHSAWLIMWASLGVLIGIALSAVWHPVLAMGAPCLVIGAALFAIVFVKHIKMLVPLALLAGLLLGLWRGGSLRQSLDGYKSYIGRAVTLSGNVSQDTTYGPKGDQRLRINHVLLDNRPLPGEVWVSINSGADIKRGDQISLSGRLSSGIGNIPATMYQAHVQVLVRPQPGDVGRRIRDRFAAGIHASLPEPEASLGIGYLVGQRRTLPETLDAQLKIVGLTHVVVASGYNLTILVSLTRRFFKRLSKYLATLAGGLTIGGFMLITGFSPSMSRAGLVAGLSLAAWYYGRKIHPVVLLILAAAVTAILQPAYVWGDVGWYLSFTSFAGVIVLAPLLQQYFWGDKPPGLVRSVLVETTSAQVATLPVILLSFGKYSLYALPANMLVLPLVPLAMLLTFVSGLSGMLAPSISHWVGVPALAVLRYSTSVIRWISSWPGAQGDVSFGLIALVACYGLLAGLMLLLWRQSHYDYRAEHEKIMVENDNA